MADTKIVLQLSVSFPESIADYPELQAKELERAVSLLIVSLVRSLEA